MAFITIPDQNRTIEGYDAVKKYLDQMGVWHEQWTAAEQFAPDADQQTILDAYAPTLQPFMKKNGYQVADVISVNSLTPNVEALKAKFFKEHTHTEDEVRFFVDGKGVFWFNPGERGPVFAVTCLAGDLLSVPAGVAHWFDMGEDPFVKVIRIFIDPSGWVPYYTETGIEQKY